MASTSPWTYAPPAQWCGFDGSELSDLVAASPQLQKSGPTERTAKVSTDSPPRRDSTGWTVAEWMIAYPDAVALTLDAVLDLALAALD